MPFVVVKQTQVDSALIPFSLPPSSLLTVNILGLSAAVSQASCWKNRRPPGALWEMQFVIKVKVVLMRHGLFKAIAAAFKKMDFQFDTGRSRHTLPYADTHTGSADVCGTVSLFLNDCLLSSADAGSGSGDDGKITHLLPVPPPPPLSPPSSSSSSSSLCCFSMSVSAPVSFIR